MRGRMSDAPSYAKPVGIGDVMEGGTVSEVIDSHVPEFAKGDIVVGRTGWQTRALCKGRGRATGSAIASGLVRAEGPEVFPNENYLTSVLRPAVVRAWKGSIQPRRAAARGFTSIHSAAKPEPFGRREHLVW
jgi:NADPH-dependent curcumin reductase CurA